MLFTFNTKNPKIQSIMVFHFPPGNRAYRPVLLATGKKCSISKFHKRIGNSTFSERGEIIFFKKIECCSRFYHNVWFKKHVSSTKLSDNYDSGHILAGKHRTTSNLIIDWAHLAEN
jgi:hypothetical protein